MAASRHRPKARQCRRCEVVASPFLPARLGALDGPEWDRGEARELRRRNVVDRLQGARHRVVLLPFLRSMTCTTRVPRWLWKADPICPGRRCSAPVHKRSGARPSAFPARTTTRWCWFHAVHHRHAPGGAAGVAVAAVEARFRSAGRRPAHLCLDMDSKTHPRHPTSWSQASLTSAMVPVPPSRPPEA